MHVCVRTHFISVCRGHDVVLGQGSIGDGARVEFHHLDVAGIHGRKLAREVRDAGIDNLGDLLQFLEVATVQIGGVAPLPVAHGLFQILPGDAGRDDAHVLVDLHYAVERLVALIVVALDRALRDRDGALEGQLPESGLSLALERRHERRTTAGGGESPVDDTRVLRGLGPAGGRGDGLICLAVRVHRGDDVAVTVAHDVAGELLGLPNDGELLFADLDLPGRKCSIRLLNALREGGAGRLGSGGHGWGL